MKFWHGVILASLTLGFLSGCGTFKDDSEDYGYYGYNQPVADPQEAGITDKYADDNYGGRAMAGSGGNYTGAGATEEVPFSASRKPNVMENVGGFEN